MNMSAMIRQFSIRTRMIGAIAMVLGLLLLVGGVGYLGMTALRDQNQQLVENTATLAKQASVLAQHVESGAAKEGGAQQDKLVSDLRSTLKQTADASQLHAKGAQDNSLMIFIIVLSLGAIIVVPLTLLNMQSICTPLAQADALANAIANGDLTGSSLQIEGQDEASHLMRSLQHMQQALQSLVSQLRTSADSIRTASVEIASGNQDLSNRTEQTASNLQQAASSMVQLTGTVRQTADSARTANQLATSASHAAAKGGEVVGQVVATMDDINTSSKKISDIIGVIDSIAFQTNILALNAAVEAARAGEQGRGFAVVASEVRSLAQRSAEAAREIKTLIGASVERVEVGSRLVQEAGSSMTDIVSSVQRVSDIIGEISAAASEQSDGIEQVNQSVVQLDQMTQQNAALVEQSAAAAESLKDQAEQLTEAVGKFRTSAEAKPLARNAGSAYRPGPAKSPAKPISKVAAGRPGTYPSPSARPAPAARHAVPHAPAPAPKVPAAARAKVAAAPSQSESEWESF
ncbi:methyl-accepting chemotaxis protein [Roseateles sp.]|uniref:methyl-accepting chemotaxis protein n=1 Tax=Roseateles sp. TaxID=1971397 RepID=UPI00286B1033|nr:methyl-accepting chemotaxis protein [Roseateles sp.]